MIATSHDDQSVNRGLESRRVFLRADPSDLQVLDGGSEEERAKLIAQRLHEWKSAANAF